MTHLQQAFNIGQHVSQRGKRHVDATQVQTRLKKSFKTYGTGGRAATGVDNVAVGLNVFHAFAAVVRVYSRRGSRRRGLATLLVQSQNAVQLTLHDKKRRRKKEADVNASEVSGGLNREAAKKNKSRAVSKKG